MEQNNITIRLLDKREITLSPEQVELYPTIQDQIADLVLGPGNIVDINYPNPKSLYQLLTNPNEALPFDSFLNMIEAADYVRNDDILNNLLVQMAAMFNRDSFKIFNKVIQESMIDLVYHLRDTVLSRFLQLIQTIKLDYEIALDPSITWFEPKFNDDLNKSLMVKSIGDMDEASILIAGAIFIKNIFITMFSLGDWEGENTPFRDAIDSAGLAIDNAGNVYGTIISKTIIEEVEFKIDYPFLEGDLPVDISNLHFALKTYNRNEDYSRLSLQDEFVAKLSQGARRYALISNLIEDEDEEDEDEDEEDEDEEDEDEEDEDEDEDEDPVDPVNPVDPEDISSYFSIVHRTDNQSLAIFKLPRGKYKRNKISGTQFPSVSPRMKIVVWQLPEDITNSRYRITAIDVPQKPTFFIYNIDFLGIPPTIFKNWPIDQGYVLFNSNEDKLLVVKKTMDGYNSSLMTNRGEVLIEHLFIADIPIFLVKDMIITVSDQLGDIGWDPNHTKIPLDAVIDTNTRLKIWYTRDITKPIPVYDNTFVPEVDGYIPWSIGDVYTGTEDSILLTLVYGNLDKKYKYKYTYRKYNVGGYKNMPEFFEDRL